jgi:hypothetical protein
VSNPGRSALPPNEHTRRRKNERWSTLAPRPMVRAKGTSHDCMQARRTRWSRFDALRHLVDTVQHFANAGLFYVAAGQ